MSSTTSLPAVRVGEVSAVVSAVVMGLAGALSMKSAVTVVKSSNVIESARTACLCEGLRCAWRAKDVLIRRQIMQQRLMTLEQF